MGNAFLPNDFVSTGHQFEKIEESAFAGDDIEGKGIDQPDQALREDIRLRFLRQCPVFSATP